MFQTIGDYAKRQRLHPRYRFLTRSTVSQAPWKHDDLGDPATVLLNLGFDGQIHGFIIGDAYQAISGLRRTMKA